MASVDLTEVGGLLETLADLQERLGKLEQAEGDGWVRGWNEIGHHVRLSAAAARRRQCEGEALPIVKQGRDVVARKADLDAWMTGKNLEAVA